MFGPPGHWYVYFIYGMHFCVNVVCCPAGIAEAVLIRAIEPEWGVEQMRGRRRVRKATELTNGPAKVCDALEIRRELDGVDLCAASSPLFIGRNPGVGPFRKARGPVVTATRIGLSQAAHLPLRFYLGGSEFVSKRARA
jgi:DNA-3-methyladenine glycosylase